MAGARIFYASGISQAISESAAEAVSAAIDIARGANLAVAYDTNYRARLWPPARAREVIHDAVRRARYVFVSQEDGEALTELRHPDALIDFYLALGPEFVILKQGHAGALLATAQGRLHLPAPAVAAVDSTGAGDVLAGAFLARILAGDEPEAPRAMPSRRPPSRRRAMAPSPPYRELPRCVVSRGARSLIVSSRNGMRREIELDRYPMSEMRR